MGDHPQRPPRRHRRAGGRARGQEHWFLAGGVAAGVRFGQQDFRHAVRYRSGRGLHHLECDGDQRRCAIRCVPAERGARGGCRRREGRRHQMRAVVEDPPHRGRRRRISRRLAARCAGATRMEGAGGNRLTPYLRSGVIAAVAVLVLDQASKLWLLFVFDIARRGAVGVTPFFDLVLAWNVGISFGWVQNGSQVAQIILMIIKAVAVIVLAIWMARSRTLIATVALGLIIGGAIGNAIDRFAYGAVVDFALFHLQIGGNTFNWYVFILADVAIVAGVAALLYDSFLGVPAAKAP